jgi:hypothetical protein
LNSSSISSPHIPAASSGAAWLLCALLLLIILPGLTSAPASEAQEPSGEQRKPSKNEEPGASALYGEGDLIIQGVQVRRVSAIPKLKQNEWTRIVDLRGAGIITHLWFTFPAGDRNFGRRNLLRIFWDDDTEPAVVAPLSDFFGLPFGFTGKEYRIDSEFLVVTPNNGLNSYFRMPFSKGARIEIFSEQEESGGGFYVQADYLVFPSGLPEKYESLRFHAQFRFENPTSAYGRHYLFLDATGSGALLGVTFGIQLHHPAPDAWFHGGGDTIYIDGEESPSVLHGIGAEDFFGCSWGVGEFSSRYLGVPLQQVDNEGRISRLSLYRFFVRDPVPFRKSIRGLMGAMGHNMSSVAYWYQAGPVKPFFQVPGADRRMPDSESYYGTFDLEPGKGLEWKLLAPFEITAEEPFAHVRDFEKRETGSETFIYQVRRGNVGRVRPTLPSGDRMQVTWRERPAFHNFVDFNEVARPAVDLISFQTGVVGYALTYLQSDVERDVWLHLGFDDELELRVNDNVVLHGVHGAGFEEKRVRAHLSAGRNRLLVKLSNYDNTTWRLWSFSFRVEPPVDNSRAATRH